MKIILKNFIDDLTIKKSKQEIISLFGKDNEMGGGKFLVKTEGDSMINAGIDNGDHLIIDLFEIPRANDIVVVDWNSAFLVKRLSYTSTGIELKSDNENYESITINEMGEVKLLVKVISVIKNISNN